MPRKKKPIIELPPAEPVKKWGVWITGPNCKLGDRVYMPGETAIIPEGTAKEWIQTGRAVAVTAEVRNGDG